MELLIKKFEVGLILSEYMSNALKTSIQCTNLKNTEIFEKNHPLSFVSSKIKL